MLSTLDSKLAAAYRAAYAATNSESRPTLEREQREWLKTRYYTKKRFLVAFYVARIASLEPIARRKASDIHVNDAKPLSFNGIRLGKPLNERDARQVFSHFVCAEKPDKLLSSLAHQPVWTCTGQTVFEGQRMSATVNLHAHRRMDNIMLMYDLPYAAAGIHSFSVSEMEDRLIRTYGLPNIFRTESPKQAIQYKSNDLINSANDPASMGDDLWAFANGASITLGPGTGYQNTEGGHIFSTEYIDFAAGWNSVSVTLPAQHKIPVILTQIWHQPGPAKLWGAGDSVTVKFYSGGDRTCKMGELNSATIDDDIDVYTDTVTCTEFVEIGDAIGHWVVPTMISIIANGNEVAFGYVPSKKAITGLTRP